MLSYQRSVNLNMAFGKSNYLASSVLLLCLLGFASTVAASDSKVGSVEKKKVFITGDHIEVIISSNKENTNVSLKQILQKLESVNAENKKLVKAVQALKGRIHTLEDKGNFLVTRCRQQCILWITNNDARLILRRKLNGATT